MPKERLLRTASKELDSILGEKFKVLDDGFIRVVDYMGNDQAIVQAARVSYGSGTKKVSQDRGLIRYLMRHRHTSPFEMCEIKLHIRIPMDAWRQWIRHRTGSANEQSSRYSVVTSEAKKTLSSQWRLQSNNNKQGSNGLLDESQGSFFTNEEEKLHRYAKNVYETRIEAGIAREQARKDLPLSTYTEAYWKIDLRNLLHFLGLRMDPHAQEEIRSYANIIGNEIVSRWCPLTWEAFRDYQLNSMALSSIEQSIICSDKESALKIAEECGWLNTNKEGKLKNNREREECEYKMGKLRLKIPWKA